jgi:hypothetical protein
MQITGGFRPSGCDAPLSDSCGCCVGALRAFDRFLCTGAGVGGGAGEDSAISNTAIGGGEGARAVGGEGNGVGNGGGGGVGRVAPRKSLGGKPAAIISRSNSSPTMCPGRAVSSWEDHCPVEEASSVEKRQKPEKIPIRSGYTPSRYSSTPSVENRTAAPPAKWTDKFGDG